MKAPPSKSYTHRALFCSALAQGESTLHSPLLCDDTRATSDALSKIGVTTMWSTETANVSRSGGLRESSGTIFCGDSGTTLRFMTGLCATTPHAAVITGDRSLLRRPVKDLAVALGELGADCSSNLGYPPVHVKGPIKGGSVGIPGNVSSQYVSALLLAGPLAEEPVELWIHGRLESEAYVRMTMHMQHEFRVHVEANDELTRFRVDRQSYCPSDVKVEGDWSSAAFLLAGATIADGRATLHNLDTKSEQADRRVLNILRSMKAHVVQDSESVTAEGSGLESVDVDVSDCPDLFPVICVTCAVAHGVSTIRGIRRLRIKESNRVQAMSEGLSQMGIKTHESEDLFTVTGGKPRKAIINPYRDHRIAMAFGILALCAEETTIIDSECVGKSYPSFWSDIQALGGEVLTS